MRIIYAQAQPTKMAKTAVVKVDRKVAHPKYHKKYARSTKLYAHDPEGRVKAGDMIYILESRPLSKLKRWVVISAERAAELKASAASEPSA